MSAPSTLKPTAPDTEVTELLDLALDLICVVGGDGYFKRVNKAWTDVLGYTKEEVLTQPWINLIHPDDREASIAEATKIFKEIEQRASRTAFAPRTAPSDGSSGQRPRQQTDSLFMRLAAT